jgi:hypothetical protein
MLDHIRLKPEKSTMTHLKRKFAKNDHCPEQHNYMAKKIFISLRYSTTSDFIHVTELITATNTSQYYCL